MEAVVAAYRYVVHLDNFRFIQVDFVAESEI